MLMTVFVLGIIRVLTPEKGESEFRPAEINLTARDNTQDLFLCPETNKPPLPPLTRRACFTPLRLAIAMGLLCDQTQKPARLRNKEVASAQEGSTLACRMRNQVIYQEGFVVRIDCIQEDFVMELHACVCVLCPLGALCMAVSVGGWVGVRVCYDTSIERCAKETS